MRFRNNSDRAVQRLEVLQFTEDDVGIAPMLANQQDNIAPDTLVKMDVGAGLKWEVRVYFGNTRDPDVSLTDVPSNAVVVLQRNPGDLYELEGSPPREWGEAEEGVSL